MIEYIASHKKQLAGMDVLSLVQERTAVNDFAWLEATIAFRPGVDSFTRTAFPPGIPDGVLFKVYDALGDVFYITASKAHEVEKVEKILKKHRELNEARGLFEVCE